MAGFHHAAPVVEFRYRIGSLLDLTLSRRVFLGSKDALQGEDALCVVCQDEYEEGEAVVGGAIVSRSMVSRGRVSRAIVCRATATRV